MIFEGRIAISAVMLAIFAGMVLYAATFPPEARTLPWIIGIPGLLLSAAQFWIEVRTPAEASGEPSGETSVDAGPRAVRREWIMFGWVAAFILGVLLFGFILAGPVLVAAYLRIDWNERWTVVLASAAICFAILYGVFERALGMDVFAGLVTEWFWS